MNSFSTQDLIEFLKNSNIKFNFNNIESVFRYAKPITSASAESISWTSDRYLDLSGLTASVLIVPTGAEIFSTSISIFSVDNPRLVFARIVRKFFLLEKDDRFQGGIVDPGSEYHESLKIGAGSIIGPNCMIGQNVTIENNVIVHSDTIIKDGVRIQSGAIIGSSGFGFVLDENGDYEHFPHIGSVIINENVEIGANSCIDKGTLGDTIIGSGSKISNLCQIAHNVQIGKKCLVAGKAQIGGGTLIGDNTYVGPSAIISNKINIAPNSDIKIGSVVVSDVQGEVSGNFAIPHKKNLKIHVKSKR